MATATLPRGPVPVGDMSRDEIEQLNRLLQARPRLPKLVGSDNQEMSLPEPIYRLLRDITPALLRGETVFLVPEHKELTTQQAADILGMSRPFLKRLLDQKAIPFRYVGTHRRIRFADVMAYREQREKERQEGMNDLLAISEEMGVYE